MAFLCALNLTLTNLQSDDTHLPNSYQSFIRDLNRFWIFKKHCQPNTGQKMAIRWCCCCNRNFKHSNMFRPISFIESMSSKSHSILRLHCKQSIESDWNILGNVAHGWWCSCSCCHCNSSCRNLFAQRTSTSIFPWVPINFSEHTIFPCSTKNLVCTSNLHAFAQFWTCYVQ